MNRTRFLLCAIFTLLFAGAAQAQLQIKGSATNLLDYRRAGASATVSGGAVTVIKVQSGGHGYLSAPQVTVGAPTGAGGTTAAATAILTAGVVTSITVTTPGSGYTKVPVIAIAPPATPTGAPATTPQFAGMANTSATAGAVTTHGILAGRYPSAIDASVPAAPVLKAVLVRASFGYSFASGVPKYFMGDEIQRPLTRWDGAPVDPSYWRPTPVKPGETFAPAYLGNLNGTAQPLVALGTVNVTSSSTSSNVVTVASVPATLVNGAMMLGQRVNIVNGSSVTLAGNASQNISASTPVTITPYQPFYYSPHAGRVFATQPGRVTLTWVSNQPDTTLPGETTPTYKFHTDVFSVSSASKNPARPLYWTEKTFNGPIVNIPSGRIVTVNTVYNTFMPSHVAQEFVPIGYTPPTDPNATPAAEQRTVWFDVNVGQGSLHAYNLEGRVFVEYLGAQAQGVGEVHEFLGADIVEVKRVADSVIVETSLGEQLRPRQEAAQDGDDQLQASIVYTAAQAGKALYGTAALPNGRLVYSAERENTNPDKIQIYWLEQDDAAINFLTPPDVPNLAIQWPKYLRKYLQSWPAAITAYQPVVVTSNGNDVSTGPQFDAAHLPQVVFQDDPAESEVSIDTTTQHLLVNFSSSADKTSRTLLKFGGASAPWYVRLYIQSQDILGTPAVTDPDGTGPLTGTPAAPSVNDLNADGVADVTATVFVGDRILPPDPGYSVAGYISNGTCYYPAGYINPFANGVPAAEAGAIIPVNATSGRDHLTIWWFKKVEAPSASFTSFYVPAIAAQYTVVYPSAPYAKEIVIASGLGTGDLGPSQLLGSVYSQNNVLLPGYNPNEEHALMVGGRGYALRDDLNAASTSQPFVLIAYTSPDDNRPSMDAYHVVRSNATYPLAYDAVAGTPQQPPMPLGALPLPFDASGHVLNVEVPGTPDHATGAGAPASYDNFTFTDRKGYQWTYRGAHNGGSPNYGMKFYYLSRADFNIPSLPLANQPPPGTPMPFIARDPAAATDGSGAGYGTSVTVTYKPKWPDDPTLAAPTVLPLLATAQTLTLPTDGLPQVYGQTSAQVVYQQSIANTGSANNSVLLHDPTRLKTFELGATPYFTSVRANGMPTSVLTTDYQGKTYFQKLPPHLQQRFYYDPTVGKGGSLVLIGQYVREVAGLNYLNLNALTTDDITLLQALCPSSDTSNKTHWDAAINGLSTTLQTYSASTVAPGTYTPDPSKDSRTIDNKTLADIRDPDTAVDKYALSATGKGTGYVTLVFGDGVAFTAAGDPVVMQIIKVNPALYTGELKVVLSSNPLDEQVTLRHSGDYAGHPELYEFQWRYGFPTNGGPPLTTPGNIDISVDTASWINPKPGTALPNQILVGGSTTAVISNPAVLMGDTWFTMAYRLKTAGNNAPWSDWMPPKLLEGWIKRVLSNITPFNQRMTDLYNNSVNTQVSLLTQAGQRWEGDIALNLSNINNVGLIQIYETVLNRGKSFTIGSGIDFDSSNNALILAAGYLNDLYNILGNEAYADAANPTISVSDQGSATEINTSRFSFEGQVSSFLEEELALLRGRDDFPSPGVGVAPVYNRLFWNFTGGINSGQAIYALNYNIQETAGSSAENGIIDAADAAIMFPQGHGDAYGHYLTALQGYYKLLTHPYFTWQTTSEAVTVAGQAVSVDYKDERKFAASAANLSRSAQQILTLVHRQVYQDDPAAGWSQFRDGKLNPSTGVTRNQGMDEWVSRSAQGNFFHWAVCNALLPDKDTNPNHTGVQVIDRTTVPELDQLVTYGTSFQSTADFANAHLNPLGLSPGAIAFDISPVDLAAGVSHFDQVYNRALTAVLNASGAFNQAATMTRLLRNQANNVTDENTAIVDQEKNFTDILKDVYGTPYGGDIGPGKTYADGYTGPDLFNWFVIDRPSGLVDTSQPVTITANVATEVTGFSGDGIADITADGSTLLKTKTVALTVQPNTIGQWSDTYGAGQPALGSRRQIGRLQQDLLDVYSAQITLLQTNEAINGKRLALKHQYDLFNELVQLHASKTATRVSATSTVVGLQSAQAALNITADAFDRDAAWGSQLADGIAEAPPTVVGIADDVTSIARSAIKVTAAGIAGADSLVAAIVSAAAAALDPNITSAEMGLDKDLDSLDFTFEEKQSAYDFEQAYRDYVAIRFDLAQQATDYQRALEALRNTIAEGQNALTDRETFRKRAAALVAGFRTNDLAFRAFRDESLQQYRTLFDLASRYTYLAAKSYDYETGLLGTPQGQAVIDRIVSARSLGDLTNGQPQATVSTLGDAGLAGTMAQLTADYSVVKGRLGINNPDPYGTVFSMRSELFRIRTDQSATSDDDAWKQTLQQYVVPDVMADADVAKLCNNIKKADGTPAPGIIIPFSSTIQQGLNFFGLPLAAGDHTYSSSSFSTKISSAGIVFPGYVGMDAYALASAGFGGQGVGAPASSDPNALSATPYVYLIPCGSDFMRAPPLGDTDVVRSWTVHDQAMPLPFNLGATAFNTTQFFNADGTLTEQPWILRKHQAFRPVSDPIFFYSAVPAEFTNSRLVARSVWNGRWKLVIPAYTLLNSEQDGLSRFVATVKDIQLFLRTYSYSGN